MKKIFIAALMTVAVSVSAFATDANTVNSRIAASFRTEFVDATDVQWTTTADYAKATFMLDDEKVEAFYDMNGFLIGTSTAVELKKLPKKAQKQIADKYAGFEVKESITFTSPEQGKKHYVSLENESAKVVLEVSTAGDISVLSKKNK